MMNSSSREGVRLALKYLWICSLVILALQGYSAYSTLPARVATNFKMSGVPNSWSPKREFFIVLYSIILGINALCLFLLLRLPRMLSGKNAWAVNVPKKAYWLATDERRAECGRLMQTMMYGIMVLMNFMMGYIIHLTVQGNIAPRPFSIWDMVIAAGPLLVFSGVYSLTAFRERDS